ncbi:hypothetical protein [Corallibacter sp.]|uniref:hypothetical protein n=1 Tax=Corallibacter sp. TaxID=2038084 RepID=UPI003AB75CFA
MKILFLTFVFASILSCANKQDKLMGNKDEKTVSICPEYGQCKLTVLKNKSIKIKEDEFGATYSQITDSNNILIEFEYKRNEIQNTADSSYKELVYIELNPSNLEVNYSDADLKKANITYARLCFCRGQTGYYNILSGNLKIEKTSDKHYSLELSFKTFEVPQIITYIKGDFSI